MSVSYYSIHFLLAVVFRQHVTVIVFDALFLNLS